MDFFSSSSLMDFGDTILLACSAVGIIFIVLYGLSAPWWRSLGGWNIMGLSFSIVSLILLNNAAKWFGLDYWGRPMLRVLVYGSLFFVLTQRIYWLARDQVYRPCTARRAQVKEDATKVE